jgi:hypothetical protein
MFDVLLSLMLSRTFGTGFFILPSIVILSILEQLVNMKITFFFQISFSLITLKMTLSDHFSDNRGSFLSICFTN